MRKVFAFGISLLSAGKANGEISGYKPLNSGLTLGISTGLIQDNGNVRAHYADATPRTDHWRAKVYQTSLIAQISLGYKWHPINTRFFVTPELALGWAPIKLTEHVERNYFDVVPPDYVNEIETLQHKYQMAVNFHLGMDLGESFSLYGKVGVHAASWKLTSELANDVTTQKTKTKFLAGPHYGIGVSRAFQNATLALEYTYYHYKLFRFNHIQPEVGAFNDVSFRLTSHAYTIKVTYTL